MDPSRGLFFFGSRQREADTPSFPLSFVRLNARQPSWSMFLPYGTSLCCVRARRSARRAAKGDAGTSDERRNEAGARPHATRRAGRFCVVGSSKGSRVVPATRLHPSPAHGRKIAPAQVVPYGRNML